MQENHTGRSLPSAAVMYAALAERDTGFEGVFVAAIKTTGIFCRPGCPARTPNPENVVFFTDSGAALAAGFRPCKRCLPMAPLGEAPDWLARLLAAVEEQRTRRWRDRDLVAMGLEPRRVRRWFLQQHGMTFHAYQRARRLGLALGALQDSPSQTTSVSTAIAEAGYESESGFREAFGRLFKTSPSDTKVQSRIEVGRLTTPLGPMVFGVRSGPNVEDKLVLLEFTDRRALESQLEVLAKRTGAVMAPAARGSSPLVRQLHQELQAYFAGELEQFSVPVAAPGTPFQEDVWAALLAIPYGETRSYADIAAAVGRPGATRAVGTTNGKNRIAIVIPCHRVVRADGSLSGYGGGVWRKRALLDLESGGTLFHQTPGASQST